MLIRRSDGYLLVCDSAFRSVMDPLVFGDQEEMGLGIRVAKPLAVKHGGQMADSQGRTTPQEIWGQEAAWCECRGQLEGKTVGVMLLADPANSFASRWHARDYGLITANPFGHKVFWRSPCASDRGAD